MLREDNIVKNNLNLFWEVEGVEQLSMTSEQHYFEQHFSSHTNQQTDGTFAIRLPKKLKPTQLGSTRLSAEQRLHATEIRLEQDPDANVQYHNFMNIYIYIHIYI